MNMKEQTLYGIIGVVFVTLACSFGAGTQATPTQVDEVGTVVVATMQALTVAPSESLLTQAPTETSGIPVSYESVSFVIPNGMASGAKTETMTAVDANSGAP